MAAFKKIIKFGKVDFNGSGRKINEVTIEIALRDTPKGPEFTACGNVWNLKHTDIICGGQCLDELLKFFKHNFLFNNIYNYWKKYHLNGMHAGTPEQEEAINNYLKLNNKKYDYAEVCDYLKSINLYEVKLDGSIYKYGHAWLYEPIPQDDLKAIRKLLTSE